MLWEVEILPAGGEKDYEGQRVLAAAGHQGITELQSVRAGRAFLVQGDLDAEQVRRGAAALLADPVTEQFTVRSLPATADSASADGSILLNVLFHPGVTDSVAENAREALRRHGLAVTHAATCRRYWITGQLSAARLQLLSRRVLANEAIEHIAAGPLQISDLSVGTEYKFRQTIVPIRTMDDAGLQDLSKRGQLYLSLTEMRTVRDHFISLDRDPTDIELETVAQTWSEHCSHKTLAGRSHYTETAGGQVLRDQSFSNMLKETIFAATVAIRRSLGEQDWCVSVFRDNAGIVKFDEQQNVCIKVETHNHPSAIEPYGGANTGLGARPVCNTDVFCFARPDYPADQLPPGVLHPRAVLQGVVSGVRDYGNRMGIPTVNGAVCFDDRYLGNPLVYCGNVAMIPVDKCEKQVSPGDLIVAVGGRTGRDGIHGATFSSVELTEESESISGGAVQIGNPVTEKMMLDVLLAARDRGLYSAITDCGAGGFSSAVGEMGADTGAEVWLDRAPLKYSGLSCTEIWISEAQERMVLAVPEHNWQQFHDLCAAEGVEATAIGRFTETHQLVLKYGEHQVGSLSMEFLHDGRPPVIREAVYETQAEQSLPAGSEEALGQSDFTNELRGILGSLNVASKEWIIRQYDHEVQGGSVIKPLTGVQCDGPSDAAVVRPDLKSQRGLVVACGINPHLGDRDPYWMAAAAIDESLRNCVAVGADPDRIAILDNFCWGNTERAETLGTLVRAAIGCHDTAIAFGTPFVSGKDSLNNEFSYDDAAGVRRTVAIPSTLLITALGQVSNVEQCVTMDLKQPGSLLLLVGETRAEFGGSHLFVRRGLRGGSVPRVQLHSAPAVFKAVHAVIRRGLVLSCHDLSEGGLAVAVAEMAFAGEVGVELLLDAAVREPGLAELPESLRTGGLLFSESNTRFLLEVRASDMSAVRELLGAVPHQEIGRTTDSGELRIHSGGRTVVQATLGDLKECWQAPLRF
ncbi:MAG: phosphoribosylformylglycinamidine synthase subunit PurL [Planctomyces sp.]